MRRYLFALILAMLSVAASASEKYIDDIMAVSTNVAAVTAKYRGKAGNITRTMYFDENGNRLMQVSDSPDGRDTLFFTAEGKYMIRICQEGGIDFTGAENDSYWDYPPTAYMLNDFKSLEIKQSSIDSHGQWTIATNGTQPSTTITRTIDYKLSAKQQALIDAAKDRREIWIPSYEAYLLEMEPESESLIVSEYNDIVMLSGIAAVILIVFLLTRKINLGIRLIIRGIFLLIAIIIGRKYVQNLISESDYIYLLDIILICWFFYSKRLFNNLAYDRDVANEDISLLSLAWAIIFTIFIIKPICSAYIGIWLVDIFVAIVGGYILFIRTNTTVGRCPKCHATKALYRTHSTRDGLTTEYDSHDSDNQGEFVMINEKLWVSEGNRRHTSIKNVFQMYRDHYKCRYCDYTCTKRRKGELVERTEKITDTPYEENARVDNRVGRETKVF